MKKTVITAIAVLSLTASQAQTFHRKPAPREYRIEEVQTPQGLSEQIIGHLGFTVSYNRNLLIPNWVSYELTPQEAASTRHARTDGFVPDPAARDCSALLSDYTAEDTGYVPGQMACPSDMRWSERALEESFYLSNVCPQDRDLCNGKWLELEQKCRFWATKYKSPVYIVCGPLFTRDEAGFIGANEVVIPDAFFKVVCQKRGDRWCAAAFIMPNANIRNDLAQLARPVAVAEILTGFKFLRNLPQDALDDVYNNVYKEDWDVPNWKY